VNSAIGGASPHRRGLAVAVDAIASLFRLAPSHGPRWPVATQAAISITVPIAVMSLVGMPQLGFQAAAGAFTALHVSSLRPRERAKVLPFVALVLVAATAVGIAAGGSMLWTLIGLVVTTIAASAFVYGFALGAPGPLFFVLVFGLAAHITATVPDVDPVVFLIAVAAGCCFSYLVALTPLLRSHVRREPARALREIMPGPVWDEKALTLLVRASTVAVVGAALGVVVDPERAYWIVSAGVAVVGIAVERRVTVTRGLHRMVGTVAGAAIYPLLILVPWGGVWLALLLGGLQFLIELVVVRHYALALLFITPLVLLITGAATGDIGSAAVAGERIVDTIVGSTVGVLTAVLPRIGGRGIRSS
jgi:hypothetical protein